MNEKFKSLCDAVDELRQIVEVKEKLEEERRDLRNEAEHFYTLVIEKYQEGERQLAERIEQAEHEHQENKKEIVELTRQQLKAETVGGTFENTERLEKLKAEVATYPLKVEALEQLKNDIVISTEERKQLKEYQAKGYSLGCQIYGLSNKIHTILTAIKDIHVLNCAASVDLYIVGRNREFMPEQFEKLQNMRKEAVTE